MFLLTLTRLEESNATQERKSRVKEDGIIEGKPKRMYIKVEESLERQKCIKVKGITSSFCFRIIILNQDFESERQS
jgi:hypothetical protein